MVKHEQTVRAPLNTCGDTFPWTGENPHPPSILENKELTWTRVNKSLWTLRNTNVCLGTGKLRDSLYTGKHPATSDKKPVATPRNTNLTWILRNNKLSWTQRNCHFLWTMGNIQPSRKLGNISLLGYYGAHTASLDSTVPLDTRTHCFCGTKRFLGYWGTQQIPWIPGNTASIGTEDYTPPRTHGKRTSTLHTGKHTVSLGTGKHRASSDTGEHTASLDTGDREHTTSFDNGRPPGEDSHLGHLGRHSLLGHWRDT